MSKRLTIIGAISFSIGVGCIAVSLAAQLAPIVGIIFQAVGALLILVGVILIGWQICSNNHNSQKSSKRKKVLKTKNRSKHVREISGTNYGEENYGGPQYNGGASVISANHHQDHRGYVQSGHGHHGGRHSQGGGGVQYSQGGGGVQYTGGGVHFNPSGVHGGGGVMLGGVNSGYQHGSMDSINTINSYNSNTLSFDSDLSVGSIQSGPLKPALRKDTASMTSQTSKGSRSTRFAIGGEQTAV